MRLSTVTIYGTGLIGGSLALAVKRAFPGVRVAGVDRPDVLDRATQLKIIDVAGPQPADLVVLATPVGRQATPSRKLLRSGGQSSPNSAASQAVEASAKC